MHLLSKENSINVGGTGLWADKLQTILEPKADSVLTICMLTMLSTRACFKQKQLLISAVWCMPIKTCQQAERDLLVVRLQKLIQRLCMEFVITQIQRCVDRLERLKVNVDLLFLALVCQDCTSVHHQPIWRDLSDKYILACILCERMSASSTWTVR